MNTDKPGIEGESFKLVFKDSMFKNDPVLDFNPNEKDPAYVEGYADGFATCAKYFIQEELEKQLTSFSFFGSDCANGVLIAKDVPAGVQYTSTAKIISRDE